MKCLNCEGGLFENEFKDLQCVNCGSIYPFSNKGLSNGGCVKTEDIIDLAIKHLESEIKRLQTENERLNKEVDRLSQVVLYNDGVTEMKVEEAKAEAYKEILNFLENRFVCKGKLTAMGYESAIIDIKNHLKEMEDEDNTTLDNKN